MQKIVGVKRRNDRDIYFFKTSSDLALGDKVVVDFDEFETVAEVAKIGLEESEERSEGLRQVRRKATEADMARYESLQKKAMSKLPEIKKKSLALGLVMKFISAEISLDEGKVLIIFSSEDRVDFRQLLRDLASMFHARIELRQIGQRDEVKICGGVGPCGQPCCCARFLKSFDHVTVKMAKVQGLSLSPTKINGVCGRLMCCLGYENKMYEEMLSKMPSIGSQIRTPNGLSTVVYNDILRERVSLKRQLADESYVVEDYSLEEVDNFKKGKFNIAQKERHEKTTLGGEEKPKKPWENSADKGKKPQKNSNKNGFENVKNSGGSGKAECGSKRAPERYGISFETDTPEVTAPSAPYEAPNETKNGGYAGKNSKRHKNFKHKKPFSNYDPNGGKS